MRVSTIPWVILRRLPNPASRLIHIFKTLTHTARPAVFQRGHASSREAPGFFAGTEYQVCKSRPTWWWKSCNLMTASALNPGNFSTLSTTDMWGQVTVVRVAFCTTGWAAYSSCSHLGLCSPDGHISPVMTNQTCRGGQNCPSWVDQWLCAHKPFSHGSPAHSLWTTFFIWEGHRAFSWTLASVSKTAILSASFQISARCLYKAE